MNYSEKAWKAARARFKEMTDDLRVVPDLAKKSQYIDDEENTARFWLECG